MALVFKEFINGFLAVDIIEYVSCQLYNNLQRLIKKMRLKSKLELGNILSSYTFFIQFEEAFPNDQWVDLIEFDGEYHLTVSVELLEHFGIAVLEAIKQYFDLLKYIFLWF